MKTLNRIFEKTILSALGALLFLVPSYAADTKKGNEKMAISAIPAPKTRQALITVESIVKFDKDIVAYKNEKLTYADVVKLGLKITNNEGALIPQPVNGNKPQHVKLYINGKLSTPAFLYTEISEQPLGTFIPANASQIYYTDFLLLPKTGLIAKYGKKFTIQWECLNVRSELVKVDVEQRTAHAVNQSFNSIAMLIRY